MRKLLTIFILFLGIFPGIANGQELFYERFHRENGLPTNTIFDIYQAPDHVMWFATGNGLTSYNGIEFKTYNVSDGITEQTILDFHPQPDGRVWCTTMRGKIFHFDPLKQDFTHYKYNNLPEFVDIKGWARPHHCLVEKDGSVNLSFTNSSGKLRISSDGVPEALSIEKVPNDGSIIPVFDKLEDGRLLGYSLISKDTTNALLVERGFYNHTVGEAITFDEFDKLAILVNDVIGIIGKDDTLVLPHIDHAISIGWYDKDKFWVGYRNEGLMIYDLNGHRHEHWLKGERVTELVRDHEGGLWFATKNGVFYAKNLDVRAQTMANNPDRWPNSVLWLTEDLMCLKTNTNEIALYNRKTDSTEIIAEGKERPVYLTGYTDQGYPVFFDGDSVVFYNLKLKKTEILRPPLCSFDHIEEDAVITKMQNTLYVFTKDSTYRTSPPTIVGSGASHNGDWYFTTMAGLRKGSGKDFIKTQYPDSLLSGAKLLSLETSLVGGTIGYGVVLLGDGMSQIQTVDGLSNHTIQSLKKESSHSFWASGYDGIDLIELENDKYSIKSLPYTEILPTNYIYDIELNKDTLWLCTPKGLIMVPKVLFFGQNERIDYGLSIFDIEVQGKQVNQSDLKNLSYDQNQIQFSFNAISYRHKQNLTYRYKLIGVDDKWNYTTGHVAKYSSLSPGDYTFIVQVKGDNEIWSTVEMRTSVSISPPYWSTWWFRTLIGLCLVLVIYLFFRFRILQYNRDITRELLRQILKKFRDNRGYLVVREAGKDVKIATEDILYVKSEGNYLEIYTEDQKYVIRANIGKFLDMVPDPIEFIRIRRTHIVRIDKVSKKSSKEIVVGTTTIPVGPSYVKELDKILFD